MVSRTLQRERERKRSNTKTFEREGRDLEEEQVGSRTRWSKERVVPLLLGELLRSSCYYSPIPNLI